MFNIEWDQVSERLFETGTDRGVLYPFNKTSKAYDKGVAWNGLTGVTETPSGAEPTALYADNIKYLTLMSNEDMGGTITAYMYPDEWKACDGSADLDAGITIGQQPRATFGLCYRTRIGNDTEGDSYGYKLHLIYGCLASASERAYSTVNDSPEAIEFSWEFTCTPVDVAGFKPTAIVTIDSTKVDAEKLKSFEEILYGKAATSEGAHDAVAPKLPLPAPSTCRARPSPSTQSHIII